MKIVCTTLYTIHNSSWIQRNLIILVDLSYFKATGGTSAGIEGINGTSTTTTTTTTNSGNGTGNNSTAKPSEDFYTKQARLQADARHALSQAKDMARLQMSNVRSCTNTDNYFASIFEKWACFKKCYKQNQTKLLEFPIRLSKYI